MDQVSVKIKSGEQIPFKEWDSVSTIDIQMACAFAPDFGAGGIEWWRVKEERDKRIAREKEEGTYKEPSKRRRNPSVGGVKVTRDSLLDLLEDIIAGHLDLSKEGTKEYIGGVIDRADSENVFEVTKPSMFKKLEINVTPLNEIEVGQPWVKLTLLEKRED
jgi:hypothetical protein